MLLPNTTDSAAPSIVFIDAIKAPYKQEFPVRREGSPLCWSVKVSCVLIMFVDTNYWYVPFVEKTLKSSYCYATARNISY